jgi:uncharacterized protein with FMN-binding domain
MPKRAVVATFLTTVALALLLSFKTPQAVGLGTTGANQAPGANGAAGAAAPAGTAATGGAAGNVTTRGSFTGQVTGSAVRTPFGTVQVQVTFQNGTMTDVQALQLPSGGGHTSQVSSYAGPQLRSEALAAQSAQIDTVSGATYTSQGYIQSLQSALDQAHA